MAKTQGQPDSRKAGQGKPADAAAVAWDDVRVFLAVQRAGGLGRAGARLGVDTSTVSRRLAALEAALGGRVFDRTADGLRPTRLAELLLPAAEAMEAAHGRFSRDATGFEAQAVGTVRLSVPPGMASTFIAPALIRLHQRHPGIALEVHSAVRPVDLSRHEADLALRSVQPMGADLVTIKITRAPWLVAAAPALVAQLGRVQSWSDLPFIAWDQDLASFGPARWLTRHASKAKIVLRTSDFTVQITAAETGLGAMLVPEPYLRVHALTPISFTPALAASAAELPEDDLWLVTHRTLRPLPRVDAVWTFLLDELKVATTEPPRRAVRKR